MIDKTIPYMGVLMQQDEPAVCSCCPLPQGFHFEFFRPGREEDWVQIQLSAGQVDSREEGFSVFARSFADAAELPRRMLFVVDERGRGVATAALWRGGAFGPLRQRIHWVAVEEAFQRRGLAKALLAQLLKLYDEDAPLYLATQTWSYAAIALYWQFGFRPYKGPRPVQWRQEGDFEAQAQEAWMLIEQKLRELTAQHANRPADVPLRQ